MRVAEITDKVLEQESKPADLLLVPDGSEIIFAAPTQFTSNRSGSSKPYFNDVKMYIDKKTIIAKRTQSR